MRIIRFLSGGKVHRGKEIDSLTARRIEGGLFTGYRVTDDVLPIEKLLAPWVPTDILCIGLNYREHALEGNFELPKTPMLFIKSSNTLNNPGDPIQIPRRSSEIDYEAELAVVIGKNAKNVPRAEAMDYVFGYTCANDVTARDLQAKDGQWARAKGFDTFCPLGPWIETELDPADLELSTSVNGEVRQRSRTSLLLHGVAELVSYISAVMTLLPGDVLLTGTPDGVGPLERGDQVSVTIEGIGTLSNRVVDSA
jgi:2-keto-4-pentenoate hydratase/2-oxohepta-3-ene-1,7-dioic acid hydratase in catechol pathway